MIIWNIFFKTSCIKHRILFYIATKKVKIGPDFEGWTTKNLAIKHKFGMENLTLTLWEIHNLIKTENIENFYFDMQINFLLKVKAPCYASPAPFEDLLFATILGLFWLKTSWPQGGNKMFTIKFYWTEKDLWEMITEQSILVSQEWHEEWTILPNLYII